MQMTTGHFPLMMWKDTSPQHFNTSDGLYIPVDGGLPYTCMPYKGVRPPSVMLNVSCSMCTWPCSTVTRPAGRQQLRHCGRSKAGFLQDLHALQSDSCRADREHTAVH